MAERVRVLVIDDDPGVRDYMEALVSRQGYRVFAVADGEQALKTLDETQPDLVTLDLVMPKKGGLEALKEIREKDPAARVVVISALDQRQPLMEALKLGAADYIVKPFEKDRVEEAINRVTAN